MKYELRTDSNGHLVIKFGEINFISKRNTYIDVPLQFVLYEFAEPVESFQLVAKLKDDRKGSLVLKNEVSVFEKNRTANLSLSIEYRKPNKCRFTNVQVVLKLLQYHTRQNVVKLDQHNYRLRDFLTQHNVQARPLDDEQLLPEEEILTQLTDLRTMLGNQQKTRRHTFEAQPLLQLPKNKRPPPRAPKNFLNDETAETSVTPVANSPAGSGSAYASTLSQKRS